MNGRLLPFGWAKFLWYRRKIEGCRVFALGVKPEYQDLGIAAAFYIEHLDDADPSEEIWWGEMGWILETNEAMNRAMEGMGGKIVRRYRIFEKELERRAGDEVAEGDETPVLGRRSRAWRSDGGACRKLPSLPLDCAFDVRRQSQRRVEERACPGRPAGDARSSRAAGCCSRCRCRAARSPWPAGSRPAPWWSPSCARSAGGDGRGSAAAAGASCAAPSWARARSSWTCTCWALRAVPPQGIAGSAAGAERSPPRRGLGPSPGSSSFGERRVHVGRSFEQPVVDHPAAVVAPLHGSR